MSDFINNIIFSIANLSLSHWVLSIFSVFFSATVQIKNNYDGRVTKGVTLFLRLNGKVSKEVKFNFKKEILELLIFLVLLAETIILILGWYNFFNWWLLLVTVIIYKPVEIILGLTLDLFEMLRANEFLLYLLDLIGIVFIFYFIRVIYF